MRDLVSRDLTEHCAAWGAELFLFHGLVQSCLLVLCLRVRKEILEGFGI